MTKEEAIKKIKEAMPTLWKETKEAIQVLVPELAESEDERIRKSQLDYWRSVGGKEWHGVPVQETIAWLEKQTPVKFNDEKDEKIRKELLESFKYQQRESRTDKEWLNGIKLSEVVSWLEKQGEQKTTAKVEKFKVKYAGYEYNVLEIKDIAGVTFYGIEDEPNHIDYVKAENCKIIGSYTIKENGFSYPTKSAMFSEQKPTREIK